MHMLLTVRLEKLICYIRFFIKNLLICITKMNLKLSLLLES